MAKVCDGYGLAVTQIWINGELRPFEEATIHVLSHAVQRGSTVFDVMRVVQGPDGPAAFGLRQHVARFQRSMALMGMEPEYSVGQLEEAVAKTVVANDGAATVKLVATWGDIPLGTMPSRLAPTITVAALQPSDMAVSDSDPETVRLKVATGPKMPAAVLPPALKVGATYTAAIRERFVARNEGFDDIVFRTADGHLGESTSQAVFIVRSGRLLLPSLDVVLDSITRRAVLDIAHSAGITAEVRTVEWDEVISADEVFLCSTNHPIWPVSAIDQDEFVAPGPVTARLAVLVNDLLGSTHELSKRWLTPLYAVAGRESK